MGGVYFNVPIDMDYDPQRRLLYVIMADGKMATLTNYRSEDVLAWSSEETEGLFLSVCVLEDMVYFLLDMLVPNQQIETL